MKICANCFNDIEIKESVEGMPRENGICECCGAEGDVVDISEVEDFFCELLSLFEKDDKGRPVSVIIEQDWNIFSSIASSDKILGDILNRNNFAYSINNNVSYIQDVKECLNVWDELKKEVQTEKRYFSNIGSFDWSSYIKGNFKVPKGTVYYRSRVIPADKDYLTSKDMGCPPAEKATAGRANPIGIPYLYLCDNIDTTFYEIRAVYLDKVSVGRFVIQRDLDLVDFNTDTNLFYAFNSENNDSLIEVIKHKILFKKISADLSKPLRRYDTEIEYVPTQLICEYCKHNGADGIMFKSSLHKSGSNIVLFNKDDAKCTKVYVKEITNVTITGE